MKKYAKTIATIIVSIPTTSAILTISINKYEKNIHFKLVFDFKAKQKRLNIFGDNKLLIKMLLMFALYSVAVIFAVLIIHESFHALAGKIVGLKNRLFGLAIFGAFVDIDMRKATKKQKAFVFLAGPLFSLLILLFPIYIVYFSGIGLNYSVYYFIWIFIFISSFINIFNLLPIIRGNDAYNVLKLYTKKTREISVSLNALITLGFFLYAYLSMNLSLIFSIAVAIAYILPVYLVDKHLKQGIKISDKRINSGFHLLKNKMGFYFVP